MDLNKTIYKRRSIRLFVDKKVEESKIKQIIESGIQAPSACNRQSWKFKILTDPEKIKLVNIGGADFIKKAPVAILVAYPFSSDAYSDEIQSASACIQNMLLKATEIGLGSCWVCHLPAKWRVRKLLNIPKHYNIIACPVFGYPQYKPKQMKRRYSYESFFIFEKKRINLRDILKYFYMRQPIRPKFVEKKFTKRFEN